MSSNDPKLFSLSHEELVAIATLGKPVGLKGGLRIFLITDFEEVLTRGATFYMKESCFLESKNDSDLMREVSLATYNPQTKVIRLEEVTNREDAGRLRNSTIYSTIAKTRETCPLQAGEFFYFDIIGMEVVEDGRVLGRVKQIDHIANLHYFVLEKDFLIPYIDRYVLSIDLEARRILTRDASLLRA